MPLLGHAAYVLLCVASGPNLGLCGKMAGLRVAPVKYAAGAA
jgi:hypothetical protein